MKLIKGSNIRKNQPGQVKIIPEEQDDLWILSNIISLGDIVSAETSRKVPNPGSGKTPVRVRFNVDVKITGVDYDNKSASLRVAGKIGTSNSYVNAGSFHTVEIEKSKAFELRKVSWDEACIESLNEGCKSNGGCDLVVVLVKPEFAHVYLVGKSVSSLCAKVDGVVRGKLMEQSKYFEKVVSALTKNVDFSVLQCMVVAGPGSTKDELRMYLVSQASKVRSMERLKSRIVKVDVNSMGKEGLMKVLGDPAAMSLIKDTKSAAEVKAVKELNEMFVFHPDKACYGQKSVDMASELLAIETLLIMDDLFRSPDGELRKKYHELVDSVRGAGGKAVVLSSMHVSGEQLAQLTGTGIAAILRFPVDIDDIEL